MSLEVSQFLCNILWVLGSASRFRSSCASLAVSSRKAAAPSSSSRLMYGYRMPQLVLNLDNWGVNKVV